MKNLEKRTLVVSVMLAASALCVAQDMLAAGVMAAGPDSSVSVLISVNPTQHV